MTKMIIVGGPDCSPATLILAHGARADMDTDFMTAFAVGLADHGLRVVRFEFPYMAERRQTGMVHWLRRTTLAQAPLREGASPRDQQ